MSSPDETSQPGFTRCRVLVITDVLGERQPLCVALARIGVEITCVGNPDRLTYTWCHDQHLVVVDIHRDKLEAVLQTVRSCQGCREISILVEASRMEPDPPAGLLPAYRAFACSFEQIVTLVQHRVKTAEYSHHSRMLL